MRVFIVAGALLAGAVLIEQAGAQSAPPPTTAAANGAKIAYINSERLLREAPGASEAQITIQRELNKARADLELLQDSIENMLNDYNQKQTMLSPDARKKQQDAINAKRNVLQQRSQQFEQQMEKRQRDLVQPIMDKVNKALEDIRKERGIAIVFNAPGAIVAADTTLDLTNLVLTRLKGPTAAGPPR